MRNRILYITRNTIPYVKELQELTGCVSGCLLMQQLDYWFERKPNGFWKFMEPCPGHEQYRDGSSWCEELAISVDEFRGAFDKIGVRHKSKAAFDAAEDKFEGKFYCSYLDRRQNLTYYFRNHELLDAALDRLIFRRKHDENPPPDGVDGPHSPVKPESPDTVNGKSPFTVNERTQFTVSRESPSTEMGKANLQETGKVHLLKTEITKPTDTTQKLLQPLGAAKADLRCGRGEQDLIYPKTLLPEERTSIEGMIDGLPIKVRQQLLDELAGAIQANAIKRGNVPFARGLAAAYRNGLFTPNLGVAVRAARKAAQQAIDQGRKSVARANLEVDPIAMKKGEEIVNAARRKIAAAS